MVWSVSALAAAPERRPLHRRPRRAALSDQGQRSARRQGCAYI